MTPRNSLPLLAVATLTALAGCRADRPDHHEEVRRLALEHERYMMEWREDQAAFARDNPVPQTRDLGENGTVVLRDFALVGRPGDEHLAAGLTWVNTTGRTIRSVHVRLTVSDPTSGHDSWEEYLFELPPPLRMTPDSSYTDHLRVDTLGLHRIPGWKWDLEVEATPLR